MKLKARSSFTNLRFAGRKGRLFFLVEQTIGKSTDLQLRIYASEKETIGSEIGLKLLTKELAETRAAQAKSVIDR